LTSIHRSLDRWIDRWIYVLIGLTRSFHPLTPTPSSLLRALASATARPAIRWCLPRLGLYTHTHNIYISGLTRPFLSNQGARLSYRSTSNPLVPPETRLVVIVNGNTASAAEIVTGVVQDTDRGLVVGETTFGNMCIYVDKSWDISISWPASCRTQIGD